MNVWKLWLELTKLLLRGARRWQVLLYLDEYSNPRSSELGPAYDIADMAKSYTWELREVDWVGGEDRFVSLLGYAQTLDAEAVSR